MPSKFRALGVGCGRMSNPPWVHIPAWSDSRDHLLELLREAVGVRAGVGRDLAHPDDDAASRGYVFHRRWVARIVSLAETTPYWAVVHGPRGVFSLDGVPIKLYRADENAPVPNRVLYMSDQEQLTIFDLFDTDFKEERIELDSRLRVRVITSHAGKTIQSFVFEEIENDGSIVWRWSIAVADIPERLATPAIKQDPPKVLPRVVKKPTTAADDE